MVRRWHADPFGFLRPMERGASAHRECATRNAPSAGTGVITFLMG